MKMRRKGMFIVFICLVLMLCACVGNKESGVVDADITKKAKEVLSGLSLDEKIAQMLVIYYGGTSYDSTLSSTIKEVKPGGFILTSPNMTTYDNVLSMVKGMQGDSDIPMIIGIDQEGGSVQRLYKLTDVDVSYIPYMYYLGKTNDTSLAYQTGAVMAKQLRTIGVNVDFAPVVDIYSNPNNTVIGKRSFGEDASIVSNMALSLLRGLEDNGVNGCIKHFPGHGDTSVDSHYDLPVINKTITELEEEELIPFKNAINAGVEMIMIGHINMPKISNNDVPSSLSKEVITDLLINKMGYNGLVITDALNMGAIKNNYTDKEIYTMAINAGVDLLLMPNGSRNAIKYINEAIVSGDIDEKRIDEAVLKILKYKYKNIKDNYLDKSYLNRSDYNDILSQIPNN